MPLDRQLHSKIALDADHCAAASVNDLVLKPAWRRSERPADEIQSCERIRAPLVRVVIVLDASVYASVSPRLIRH